MSASDTQMPPVAYADLGEVRMAYHEVAAGQGVPVVFCHGFPELAFSWRHQLRAFEAAGRWAIAPDQRGYGGTSRPEAVEAYDMERLTGDLAGLLDHLGIAKAIFCGHDWGGIVAWQMPLRHPARVAGVIGVNTPFMPRPPADPIEIMRRRFGEAMYIVAFQTPAVADAVLAADVARTMSFFMRRPAPGTPPASGGLSRGALDGGERREGGASFALIEALKAWNPEGDPRPPLLSDAEMAVFVDTFRATGFTGGINWYRNFSRNWRAASGIVDMVTCPALMVMAGKDAVLPPSAADGMEAYVADLEKRLIEDSGHWTQQEQPEALNAVLFEWLDRRFPR